MTKTQIRFFFLCVPYSREKTNYTLSLSDKNYIKHKDDRLKIVKFSEQLAPSAELEMNDYINRYHNNIAKS